MKRFVLAATAAAAMAMALSAQAQTVLKFSHTDQQAGARQAAAELFAKKVEELTQGRYKVQVFCCSQLGNDPKNIEQLALGGIDFTVSGTGSYAPHVCLTWSRTTSRAGSCMTKAAGSSNNLTRLRPRAFASWPPGKQVFAA